MVGNPAPARLEWPIDSLVHSANKVHTGVDDLCCIYPNGELHAWETIVPPSDPTAGQLNPPDFRSLGMIKEAEAGFDQDQIYLADIDGDGRVDYLGIEEDGDIHAWRNGGQNPTPQYWQDLGVVFTGKNMGDTSGVRLVDINGDGTRALSPFRVECKLRCAALGRDDWLYVEDDGSIRTFINQRGFEVGLAPAWLDAGITHTGDGTGVTDRSQVVLANIWATNYNRGNTWPDYNGGGADYVVVKNQSSGGGRGLITITNMDLHVNDGHGGTRQKGDGDRYCDMRNTGSGKCRSRLSRFHPIHTDQTTTSGSIKTGT